MFHNVYMVMVLFYYMLHLYHSFAGKKHEVCKLIDSGVRQGIWSSKWKPEGMKSDVFSYIQEKMKRHAKQKRTEQNKQCYNDKFNDLLAAL